MKEIFTDELSELWSDFVGDTPELKQKGDWLFSQPDADMTSEVADRKAEIEKVLAFRPVADAFINSQEESLEQYVNEHVDYLKSILSDKIGSGLGTSRGDLVLRLSEELSLGGDDPPALLVALYVVKYGSRFKE
jgi:hypothetical protein